MSTKIKITARSFELHSYQIVNLLWHLSSMNMIFWIGKKGFNNSENGEYNDQRKLLFSLHPLHAFLVHSHSFPGHVIPIQLIEFCVPLHVINGVYQLTHSDPFLAVSHVVRELIHGQDVQWSMCPSDTLRYCYITHACSYRDTACEIVEVDITSTASKIRKSIYSK